MLAQQIRRSFDKIHRSTVGTMDIPRYRDNIYIMKVFLTYFSRQVPCSVLAQCPPSSNVNGADSTVSVNIMYRSTVGTVDTARYRDIIYRMKVFPIYFSQQVPRGTVFYSAKCPLSNVSAANSTVFWQNLSKYRRYRGYRAVPWYDIYNKSFSYLF
jgi:hypothetical protein